MSTRRLKAWYLIFLISLQDVFCAHQWRISDDGKKIEAVIDSPFSLNYPGSLVDFLRQVDSVKAFGKSYLELNKTLRSITKREKLDEPDIESRVKIENPHCQRAADIKITKDLFKSSYSLEVCTDYAVLNQEYISQLKSTSLPNNDATEPLCSKFFEKSNFPAEQENNLKISELKGRAKHSDSEYLKILSDYLDFKGKSFKEISKFLGKMLAWTENKEISAHPYLHMMAAAYWRSDGNVNEALNCYRTAATVLKAGTHHSGEYRAYMEQAIQTAAITLLNYAGKPNEAAVLAMWFSDSVQPFSDPFCRLTLIHAVNGDCLLSIEKLGNVTVTLKTVADAARDYAEAIHLESQMMEKDRKKIHGWDKIMKSIEEKHSVLSCQLAVTKELEEQRVNLELLLTEKLRFNEIYGTRMQNEEQILSRIADAELRNFQKLGYELSKYGFNPHRECVASIAKRFPLSINPNNIAGVLYCEIRNPKGYEDFIGPMRKKTLTSRPPLNDTTWRIAELFPKDRNFEKKLKNIKENLSFDQAMKKKYPLSNSDSLPKDRYWRRTDWPSTVDCQAIVSKTDIFSTKSMLQIWIPPEDRGYMSVASELLTKYLGLEHNDEHPLPWNEPFCQTQKLEGNPFSPYSSIKTIMAIAGFKAEYAEGQLKAVLIRLADKLLDMAEVGQRIRTLLEDVSHLQNIGPRWLALNLAGLYWRVKGYPRQALYCLMESVLNSPNTSDLALFQIAQVIFRATGSKEEALEFLNMAAGVDKEHPYLPWLQGRIELLVPDVDGALYHLKDAVDKDPGNRRIAEDLLKVACSGKSTKHAISSQFPTVCCTARVQNAVCFKTKMGEERCYVVEESSYKLVYNRCNGIYTGVSYPTAPFVNIVSPFLSIFQTLSKPLLPAFVDDAGAAQSIETDELPLDYGGTALFFAPRPQEWWSRTVNEMRYRSTVPAKETVDFWEEEVKSNLAKLPPKPLSFLWIKEKREMLEWDVRLPEALPRPSLKQIRKGLEVFPPPRHTNTMCNGVSKLSVLLEKQMSTWVSVTAKGIDIEKYVDLRGPVPGIAGLLPVCPSVEKTGGSPILGMDHLPVFALSDQFLFYKKEKMLTDSLKSLGNERDTIDHVAARLHTAMLANAMGQNGANVNWLLCVLSSLYWRVVGDAPRAVGCLQCALQTAPPQMRDVSLVSLANIAHQAGLLHSALIAAGAALSVSPNLVAIHFTIANIYASIGDYQKSLEFYYSTLALQYNFDPAKERIRAIYCHSGEKFTFQAA